MNYILDSKYNINLFAIKNNVLPKHIYDINDKRYTIFDILSNNINLLKKIEVDDINKLKIFNYIRNNDIKLDRSQLTNAQINSFIIKNKIIDDVSINKIYNFINRYYEDIDKISNKINNNKIIIENIDKIISIDLNEKYEITSSNQNINSNINYNMLELFDTIHTNNNLPLIYIIKDDIFYLKRDMYFDLIIDQNKITNDITFTISNEIKKFKDKNGVYFFIKNFSKKIKGATKKTIINNEIIESKNIDIFSFVQCTFIDNIIDNINIDIQYTNNMDIINNTINNIFGNVSIKNIKYKYIYTFDNFKYELYILSDIISNSYFSKFFYIRESNKTVLLKNLSSEISDININKTNIHVYFTTSNNETITLSINNINNDIILETLTLISESNMILLIDLFKKMLTYYNDNKNEIFNIYNDNIELTKNIDIIKNKELTNLQELRLIDSEVFDSNFQNGCNAKFQPSVMVEKDLFNLHKIKVFNDDIKYPYIEYPLNSNNFYSCYNIFELPKDKYKIYKNNNYYTFKNNDKFYVFGRKEFKRKNNETEFKKKPELNFKLDNKEFRYIIPNNKYVYLKKHNNKYYPCCRKTNSDNIIDSFFKNKEQQQKKISTSAHIITTDKFLDNNFMGTLPNIIKYHLNTDNIIREGVQKSNLSLLYCILKGINKSYDINKYINKLNNYNKSYYKQQLFNFDQDINEDTFLDSKVFIYLLSDLFKVNILIFTKFNLEIPIYKYYNINQQINIYKKTICIYRNKGSKIDINSHDRYEIIKYTNNIYLFNDYIYKLNHDIIKQYFKNYTFIYDSKISNQYPILHIENITKQYIDNSGKCRIIYLDDVMLLTDPIHPIKNAINIDEYDNTLVDMKSIIKLIKKYKFSINSINTHLNLIFLNLDNIKFAIYTDVQKFNTKFKNKIIINHELYNFIINIKNDQLTIYNKYKKIASYIGHYFNLLYKSKYITDDDFKSKYILIDNTIDYTTIKITQNIDLTNMQLMINGKLRIQSQKLYDRLLFGAKLLQINDLTKLTIFNDYYLNKSDFIINKNELLFMNLEDLIINNNYHYKQYFVQNTLTMTPLKTIDDLIIEAKELFKSKDLAQSESIFIDKYITNYNHTYIINNEIEPVIISINNKIYMLQFTNTEQLDNALYILYNHKQYNYNIGFYSTIDIKIKNILLKLDYNIINYKNETFIGTFKSNQYNVLQYNNKYAAILDI